jgi:hypothetical protein
MLQFLSLLSCSTLGFAGASPLMTIIAVATLLTAFEIPQDRALAARFSSLGSARVLSLALAQSALTNLVFAAFSFALGKGIVWLVNGLS